ncbi:MAG: hydrogenase [Verrucomicrobia bacterium]|nr:hydrogenase [Verrucomicrobiota bacterium]MBU4247646.1 hydrogenase [Verrucomicrobiota bacterium]MBU4292418.1 hydrogenase [Verrucomicrobiota bacterium]MBU4428405.1 hydrogenase [Verrucomicrobiota bacterium]MCG2680905.1 hydrogenase [Kiritimatiellia bacterium]
MTLLVVACGLLLLTGLGALLLQRRPRGAAVFGVSGTVAAAMLGLYPCLRVLLGGSAELMCLPWPVPGGAFAVGLDAVSAVFLIPVLFVAALSAIYGVEYLQPFREGPAAGRSWFYYNVLVASMVMVLLARNGLLFLMAWECMSLASFFLVMYESEKPGVREAGWVYLVATHLGTACLVAMFVLLGREAGSLDFGRIGALPPAVAAAAFCLAIIGFGTKAGFVPLHVWLPEAHPAAPSHVSALLSGVMIKTGIYGLVRMLMLLGPPRTEWGWVLIGIGLTSGILGVAYALAQHDLKRLLAYHSVENIGIIALGLGVGVLGLSTGHPLIAQLGFGGALLHVVNHALFKSLLFLGAGAVVHATGTRDIDHLGGLAKVMPWTAAAFFVGAVAISGLPPLNGFVSEFLVYYGSFLSCLESGARAALPFIGAIVGLALIGGLASACFAKAFGIVFLGEPRTEQGRSAHDPGWTMRLPMLILAMACGAIGLGAPWAVRAMRPAVALLTHEPTAIIFTGTGNVLDLLGGLTECFWALVGLVGILGLGRWVLLRGRVVRQGLTWDCGYAVPSPRMQYTASSFAQWFVDWFRWALRTEHHRSLPQGVFSGTAFMNTETEDGFHEGLFRPVFERARWAFSKLRWIQHGQLQLYVLYIALTLVLLLIWYASHL